MSAQIYLGGSGEYQVIPNQGVIQKAKEICTANSGTQPIPQPIPQHNINHQYYHEPQLFPRQSESVLLATPINNRGNNPLEQTTYIKYGPQTQTLFTSSKFECAICHHGFGDQFQFFEHLKGHYESGSREQMHQHQTIVTCNPVQSQNQVTATTDCPENHLTNHNLQNVVDIKQEIVEEESTEPLLYSPTKISHLPLPPPLPPPHENVFQATDTSLCFNDDVSKTASASKSKKRKKADTDPPLSCQRCQKTFRKVKNFELHRNCCQLIPNDEEIPGVRNGSMQSDESVIGRKNISQTERVPVPQTSSAKSTELPPKQTLTQVDLGNNEEDDDGEPDFPVGFDDVDDDDEEEQTEMMYLESNICPSCDEMCESKADLDEHIRNLHPEVLSIESEDSKKKKKNGCGTSKKQEVLKCTECHRVFNHRNSLVYHLRGHTGERPHKCDVCNKRFFATSALKVHQRLHSGEKAFNCKHCGRDFRQWGDLKYHIISIHSNVRPYQCEFCGKNFARSYSLIVHRRIHTGERNYKCEFCSKSFRAASYLQNHRRIHTGEKPHACSICNKPFRVRSDMKRHMESHARNIKVVNAIPITITTSPVSVVSSIEASVLQPVPIQPKESSQNIVASIVNVNATEVTSGSISHRVQTPQDAFKTAICLPIVSQATSPTVITGETINIINGGVHGVHTTEILQNGVATLQASVPQGMTLYGEYQDTGAGLELITTEGSRANTVVLLPLNHHYIQN